MTAVKERLKFLENEQSKPDLWDDREKATAITKEFSDLKEEVEKRESLLKDFSDLAELAEIEDSPLTNELEDIKRKLEEEETKAFMSGKYDQRSAILQIFAGAGGQDAQDWATILLRMYERYLTSKGYDLNIIEQSFGDGGGPEGRIGTKEVTLEVKGRWAFGILKNERGVHRLVRISPFSPKDLRHTSFALVDVLPEIDQKEEKIEISPDEIKVDTYRSSGPGGQNVNKRETAIRITHLPTGIIASSQNERYQAINKEKAMSILVAKLSRMREEERDKELSQVKGDKVSVGWGNQIRSYVLHPYKMVKDLRTDVETSQVEDVLDGDLDRFIESGIKLNSKR